MLITMTKKEENLERIKAIQKQLRLIKEDTDGGRIRNLCIHLERETMGFKEILKSDKNND